MDSLNDLPDISEVQSMLAGSKGEGLTYAHISKLTGIDISTISRIKSGVSKDPRYSHVKKIYEVLKRS